MTTPYIPQVGDYFFAKHKIEPTRYQPYYARMDDLTPWESISGDCRYVKSIDDRPWLRPGHNGLFDPKIWEFVKLPAPHNPDRLSNAQLEPKLGYRFLDEDEILEDEGLPELKEIENWVSEGFVKNYKGSEFSCTYRTKLTRQQLRELRGLSQPQAPKPMSSELLTQLRNIPFVSFSGGQLALLVAYWLKAQGYSLSMNITTDGGLEGRQSESGPFSLRLHQGEIRWYNQEQFALHFTSFSAFKTWYSTPEIVIPNFGEYPVSITTTGVKVGCTEVTWQHYDSIIEAVRKARALVALS